MDHKVVKLYVFVGPFIEMILKEILNLLGYFNSNLNTTTQLVYPCYILQRSMDPISLDMIWYTGKWIFDILIKSKYYTCLKNIVSCSCLNLHRLVSNNLKNHMVLWNHININQYRTDNSDMDSEIKIISS